ncbi:related to JSN1-RNA-binding protein (pumilio family) [Sporisorium reilianum f. sp. reilianum]|uniref:Related to JSN1-RNA-binding protein (Pumilio family) n=1 Tax=Sporisorium reilianum f. sp. reilianum TaxID=72559 RepID=A0A2N8U5I4_9BASI|nr:related to JSN1-RNA-binding protein (pumilio family) [Sporisorium reilianum f. sp. reilianum]
MHDPYNGHAANHSNASSSTSASTSTPPSQPAFLSRRALHLQAQDEAFRSHPTYRTASIANDSDPIVEPAESSRSARGRARAGTLPSSWGDAIPTLPQPSQSDPRPPLQHISHAPRPASERAPLHDLTRVGSASHTPASNDAAPFDADLASSSSSQRFRSGSLTLPTANLANAFGPSFFSSHWQPTRSGLSTMTSAANEDDANSPTHTMDASGPRFSFDNADMLDYLGLGAVDRRESGPGPSSYADPSLAMHQPSDSDRDFADPNTFLASAQFRNRSSTLGVQQLRPRLNNGEGRARSSSYLPSFAFNPTEAATDTASQPASTPAGNRSGHLPGSQSPYAGNAPHSSLLNTALHNRLHQYSAAPPAHASDSVNRASASPNRPRATSMGVLDQLQSRAPMLMSQYRAGPPGVLPSTLGGFDSIPTPPAYPGHLNLPPHVDSATDLSAFLANGRNRSGTIAAFSGPGGRARAEQALLRMTQMQYEASLARDTQSRPSSSSASEASSLVDVYGHARTQQQQQQQQQRPASQKSGASSPFVQPTRTLWIGHLRPTVTNSDLLQILTRYGSIETIRLVPEKSCAFVNFVEIADAVRAKEDLLGRLGGRLGLGSMGPEGQVRVGFGKPESVPQVGLGGFAPNMDTLGGLADGAAANDAFGAEPVNQEASRALWIGSIPSTTSTETLVSIFAPFGPIESIRVLASKSCAFVNFDRLDDAMAARKALHGREVLGAEVGPVRIGFAKVPARVSDSYFGTLDPGSVEFQAAMDALASLSGVVPGTPMDSQLSRGLEDPRHGVALDALSRHHYLQPNALNPHNLVRNLSTDAARPPNNGVVGRTAGFPAHSSSNSIVPSSDKGGVPLPAEMKPKATINDLQMLMRELDETDPGVEADIARIARSRPLITYFTRIPPVPELPPGKRFDNNRLKEVRKRLEAHHCLASDADAIARDYLPCIVDLSSDFIGNTLVQKFFERCSEPMKKTMLELIAPHLAMIGVHKNGTWAAQKIIDCTHADDQRAIIAQHIRPYVPPLLLDQFGNYVVQRLIPFGSPHSDFIFEAMVDRCWEVAQGRFGSRSMRACLESPQVPKFHIKQVALAIVLNSVPLATSQNGALLVTWLLDASALPGRFRLLAPRFAPHLANLCTHKLASQTVLRIVSQKTDVEASRQLLRVLFEGGRPQLLEEVLVDQVHGSQFVTKLFAEADVLEGAERQRCAEEVKALLIKHGLVTMPPYRPLAVEMGLLPAINVPNGTAPINTNTYDTAALERQLASMHVSHPAPDTLFAARRDAESEPLWSHPSPSQDTYDPYNPVFLQQQQQQRNEHFSVPQHSYQHHLHDSRTFF